MKTKNEIFRIGYSQKTWILISSFLWATIFEKYHTFIISEHNKKVFFCPTDLLSRQVNIKEKIFSKTLFNFYDINLFVLFLFRFRISINWGEYDSTDNDHNFFTAFFRAEFFSRFCRNYKQPTITANFYEYSTNSWSSIWNTVYLQFFRNWPK